MTINQYKTSLEATADASAAYRESRGVAWADAYSAYQESLDAAWADLPDLPERNITQ